MAAVAAAVLVGIFIGLLVRPILDAYLSFKTAQFYKEYAPALEDEHDDVSEAR